MDRVYTLIHEGGHQLGLSHAQALHWEKGPLSSTSKDAIAVGYQNWYSQMGQGKGYYDAYQLSKLGWLDDGTEIKTIAADRDGDFELFTLNTKSKKVKALRIERSRGEYIWVEYRQPTDPIEKYNYKKLQNRYSFYKLTGDPMDGVLMYLEDKNTWPNSWLVSNPANEREKYFYTSIVRDSFEDPTSSLKIEILNTASDKATVRITRVGQKINNDYLRPPKKKKKKQKKKEWWKSLFSSKKKDNSSLSESEKKKKDLPKVEVKKKKKKKKAFWKRLFDLN